MGTVADIKVRQLDERVARTLKTRAAKRDAFRRRAAALRAASAGHRSKRTDSARTIRQERDATG